MTPRLLLASFCLLAGFGHGALAQQAASPSPPTRGVTLSGRIVDAYPGAEPQPDAVLIMRLDGPPTVPNKIPIRPDRTFVAEDLQPGQYLLQASRSLASVRVSVGSSAVTGIDLVVSGQVRLRPDVRMDDGSAVPAGVMYRTQTTAGDATFGALGSPLAPPGPPGAPARPAPSLPLTVSPGSRWLFIRPPAGYDVLSARLSDADLLRSPLETTPADDGRPLEVVLTRSHPPDAPVVSVSGTIGGLAGVEAELIDVSVPNRRSVASVTTTGSDGSFMLVGLRPGVYDLNLPPVDRVVTDIVAGAGEVRVDVPMPAGARVVGGLALVYQGGGGPTRRGPIAVVAEREGARTRIPIADQNTFWGALAPGSYRLTVEGLGPGFSIRALTAGSVNLLEQPFVVPLDRPAEIIRLELSYGPSN